MLEHTTTSRPPSLLSCPVSLFLKSVRRGRSLAVDQPENKKPKNMAGARTGSYKSRRRRSIGQSGSVCARVWATIIAPPAGVTVTLLLPFDVPKKKKKKKLLLVELQRLKKNELGLNSSHDAPVAYKTALCHTRSGGGRRLPCR